MPGNDVEAELPLSLDELLRGGRRRITLNGRSLDVDIPPGVRDGTVLRLSGEGEPGIGGGPPGDLYLRIRLVPDSRYRPVGDDLEMELPLSPWQAVLGDELKIDTPDGPVTIRVPAGTQSGRRLRLRGRGLPRRDGTRGDLHAIARIVIPERPTPAEQQAYQALQEASAPAAQPAYSRT
jgi:curved DNA-binding protein